jgi:hypothetical protein
MDSRGRGGQHREGRHDQMLVHSAVQVKMGIFIMPMPGARILMMVTSKLMPDSNVHTRQLQRAQM